MDERLCVLCGALVDLSDPNVKVLTPGGGGRRKTILVDGRVHVVTTKRITELRLKAQEEL